ncbi:retrovirus-related Pol polyprotein LINE-1 [Elysia marginata]|uniref:Retrovirus-related Pol polyprotein LINE-1 n=1 Tax=Elysia marginata TaxID=1093978 RepID=A0AAV4G7W3_9GAST|nr:retrovirus-related Pol polyprotein LINE-1 [Elysia marginata]
MVDCQKDLNLCFIDYAKAFDRVNHKKLIEVLAKAGIPSHERQLACEIYWNQSAKLIKRKLGYAGHTMRGISGPLLQLSLEGEIEWKREQGRPRRSWMDDVKEWSGSTSYGDTKRKAENREEWRDMVAIANLWTEDGT